MRGILYKFNIMLEQSVHEDINQNICPITLEPINIYGITCYGSFYEYSAISDWLQNHNTDPLTNLPLPSKGLKKVLKEDFSPVTHIDHKKSCLLWCYHLALVENSIKIYNNLIALENNAQGEYWDKYSNAKKEQLIEGKVSYYEAAVYGTDIDNMNDYIRPSNTGSGFNFVDLSNCEFEDRDFKCASFNFANLSNCMFINCSLSRCSFIRANLTKCMFFGCDFKGESVSFYKAITTNCLFVRCSIERVDRWVMESKDKTFKKILSARLYNVSNPYTAFEYV